MDGFAQAYYDESGIKVASRIMGYHTGANVPVRTHWLATLRFVTAGSRPSPGRLSATGFTNLPAFSTLTLTVSGRVTTRARSGPYLPPISLTT